MATERRPAYLDRITIDPEIMVGKPTVRGTRIPVELVLANPANALATYSYHVGGDELTRRA